MSRGISRKETARAKRLKGIAAQSVVPIEQEPIPVKKRAEPLTPKTKKQEHYLHALENFEITFGIGPAGTGKSYVATSWAAEELKANRVEKLIFTRPAVEAGEKLGFLPGELNEKFAPYLTPVREILDERLGKGYVEYLLKTGRIEATPIGYLRGRTFNDTIVLLDEAQNTTPEQMKMFLTRFGRNCTMIIEGDITQKDIHGPSGLEDAISKVSYIPTIKVIEFSEEDIVRSGLVSEIVQAYKKK